MHAYLGVTCHFVTKELNILSLLLSSSKIFSCQTAENIPSDFEEVVIHIGISPKVYRVVTDNAYNVKKAFPGSLPRFELEHDQDSEDNQGVEEDYVDEQTTKLEHADVQLEDIEIPLRVSCLKIVYNSLLNMASCLADK